MKDRHPGILGKAAFSRLEPGKKSCARNGDVMEEAIAANLPAVRSKIETAARASERAPGGVTLVAVSKTHPATRVRQALAAGHRVCGKNRMLESQTNHAELLAAF